MRHLNKRMEDETLQQEDGGLDTCTTRGWRIRHLYYKRMEDETLQQEDGG